MGDLLRKAYLENNRLCWQGWDQGEAGEAGEAPRMPNSGRHAPLASSETSSRPPLLTRVPAGSRHPTLTHRYDKLWLQRLPQRIARQTGEMDLGRLTDAAWSRGGSKENTKQCQTLLTLRRKEIHKAFLFPFFLFSLSFFFFNFFFLSFFLVL